MISPIPNPSRLVPGPGAEGALAPRPTSKNEWLEWASKKPEFEGLIVMGADAHNERSPSLRQFYRDRVENAILSLSERDDSPIDSREFSRVVSQLVRFFCDECIVID